MTDLSPREREIVEMVTAGVPDKRIAAQLGISPFTVRNYLARIVEKLALKETGLARRPAIAEWAREHWTVLIIRRVA